MTLKIAYDGNWTDENQKEENLVSHWVEKPCLFFIESKEHSNRQEKN